MDKALRNYLRENEQILWQGKAEPFPLLDNATKFRILCKWILTAALSCGVLLMYFYRESARNVSFIGIVVAVAAIIIASPLMERHILLGQRYCITNQRAILMSRDQTFYYMELAEIDDYQLVQGLAAQECLVLGSSIFEDIHKQLRWRSCHPKIELQSHTPQDCVAGLIFYCADHLDVVANLLEQRNHLHAA